MAQCPGNVLTKDGWVFFSQVTSHHCIATVNLKSDQIEYQHPFAIIKKRYDGELITFKSGRLDIEVTPNHRMVVNKVLAVNGKKTWDSGDHVVLAKDVKPHMAIKMRSNWAGSERESVCLPMTENEQLIKSKNYHETKSGTFRAYVNISGKRNGKTFTVETDAKKYVARLKKKRDVFYDNGRNIDIGDFAEFLGWYVSEGSCTESKKPKNGVSHRVQISQIPGLHSDKIKTLLERLPWKFRYDSGVSFTITSKQLYDYVSIECGKGHLNKKVPNIIKEASPGVIKRFVDAAIDGDGWTQDGHRTYATTSRQLADDMQELFIKLGKYAIVRVKKKEDMKPATIRGRLIYSKHDQYHISEIRTKRAYLYGAEKKSCISGRQYSGMVYCASVPHGTLICRRNGKSFIAGNCFVYAYAAAIRAGLPYLDLQASANGKTVQPKKRRRIISEGVK